MTTQEHARWKRLAVRRPDDVPGATPLSWQIEKHQEHNDRLMNNSLPASFPYEVERGDAGDALAVIALRESIRRDMEYGRGCRVHEALNLGATWSEVAAALDVSVADAREVLRSYADGQRRLHLGEVGRGTLGFTEERHAEVVALCERGDDERLAVADVAPAAVGADAGTGPVKESTRQYAEELRANPGKASADGHTGWECSAGASLIVGADTPGPGKLGTHHGAIYACREHQDAAEVRVTGAGYGADVRPAPPGHRHSPWPCGHVTAYSREALADLSGRGAVSPQGARP